MNDQERELDLMVAELEQENRLLRARNERLEQRTWVGLTDDEVTDLWHKTEPYYNEYDFAKAYEAKLKEKNNAI